MELPGLCAIDAADHPLLPRFAEMMGLSFLEEPWTAYFLDCLGGDERYERKLEISRAIMAGNFRLGVEFISCYGLPDASAVAGAYRKNDLGDRRWSAVEEQTNRLVACELLTEDEARVFEERACAMAPVSVFDWEEDEVPGGDFIHFYALGVDPAKRGSGAFRRLMTPFFELADREGIPSYLETYSDDLQRLYEHVGFELIRRIEDPAIPIVERCMVRRPR